MTRYYVEGVAYAGTYTVEIPERAVACFYNEHYGRLADEALPEVKVYVLDYIGNFKAETRVLRLPRQTAPDAPKAKAKAEEATSRVFPAGDSAARIPTAFPHRG